MARRLPKQVRVLGMRIFVETQPELEFENEHGEPHKAYGMFFPGYPGIVLNTDNGPERMKYTLVHEVLHAIVNQTNILTEDEEALVSRMAPALLDFIRDNKAAVAYLQES